MPEKVRLGFIGAGMFGRHHIRTFGAQPGVILAGVASRTRGGAARVAERLKVAQVFDSAEALLADPSIDAVVISAPNRWHEPYAVAALAAGKHVLVEKPMAVDGAAARRIVAAQEASGKHLLVAQQRRWTWPALRVAEEVKAGRLGDIYAARAVWRRRKGIPAWGSWFTTREQSGGGAMIDVGIHVLDLALALMGDPQPLSVSAGVHGMLGARRVGMGSWGKTNLDGVFDVEDYGTALIRLANGATLSFEAGWAGHGSGDDEPFVGLLGTGGGAELLSDTRGRLFFERDGRTVDTRLRTPMRYPDPYAQQARHFLACVRGEALPVTDARSGLRRNVIFDALYESARTGREMAVEPV